MEPPIRILAIVPEPIDASWSSVAAAVWTSLESALRARIVKEALETYLADNTQAWTLQSDGNYVRTTSGETASLSSQSMLLKELAETP